MRSSMVIAIASLVAAASLGAQPGPRTPNDTLRSPVVAPDGRVTFQLYAPRATAVTLRTEGPAPFENRTLTRNEQGVWSGTFGPIPPDLYIYWFDVDGAVVADPRNPRARINLSTVRSFLDVRGADAEFHAVRDVPHGTVSMVWYHSKSLGVPRRLHVYTPPGYETSGARYPILYLLHGAGDDDESWLRPGRANFILDNLVAEGKAKPMIVVMTAGHVPEQSFQQTLSGRDRFAQDFLQDVVPLVERRYRVLPGRANRAIAGLSMGGYQTLNIGLTNLDRFSQLGVFSSGLFGDRGPENFERANAATLDDPRTKARLRLLWIATGKDDFVMPATKGTLAMLDRHGVKYTYRETAGGHTWPVWRAYLREFAPLLFR